MENQQGSHLFGRNIFTDAFHEFDEERFFSDLHHRVRNKSYFQKYKGFKTTLLWLSYLFNIASALTASYAVYWLIHQLTGIDILSWCIAIIFLFFLEKIKRKSSTEFWQALFFERSIATGWLTLSFICLALSLASSAFGVKEGTEDLGPGAELIATDQTAQDYRNRIAALEADNLKLEQQRNAQGQIFWPAQKEKEKNKGMITDLQAHIFDLDKKLEGKNEKLSFAYQQDIKITAWTLVYVTIAMELLFEICIAWIWYYYFRSYVERKRIQRIAEPSPTLPENDLGAESFIPPVQTFSHPPFNGNGQTITSQTSFTSLPIGFFTDTQRAQQQGKLLRPENTSNLSVQTCTDVYRQQKDRNTVMHCYSRNGQYFETPYTRNQIIARINQYEREVQEAIKREMQQTVLANRQTWLTYWQTKLQELKQKAAIKK
jgi:uncharacterized FlaG/YvyC family protein